MNIKLVVSDIDGVWTDGGMYYSPKGEEMKKFNTLDSAGVLFLKAAEIPLVIITGENSEPVKMRLKKLNIESSFFGIKNKLTCIEEYCSGQGINIDDVAYIGDDLNDIQLLKKAGLSATPSSSADYVKKEAQWVLTRKGGDGAFREFVERILIEQGIFEKVLAKVLNSY